MSLPPKDESDGASTPKPAMRNEIEALVGAIAKALALTEAETAKALENGEIDLSFGEDAQGNRFVAVTGMGKTARVYQGAIRYSEDGPGS